MAPIPIDEQCNLLDDFGQFIQVVCGLVAFSVLIVKRHRERPRRPFVIWLMDVSKQAVSGLAAHFIGMITAELLAEHTTEVSPCSWYLIAFVTDVTLGVGCALLFLKTWIWIGRVGNIPAVANQGDYLQQVDGEGNMIKQPSKRVYLIQMTTWAFFSVAPARFVCMFVIYTSRDALLVIAQEIGYLFEGHPHEELMTVMLIGPLMLNAIQFLVQDYFLKKQRDDYFRLLSVSSVDLTDTSTKGGGAYDSPDFMAAVSGPDMHPPHFSID